MTREERNDIRRQWINKPVHYRDDENDCYGIARVYVFQGESMKKAFKVLKEYNPINKKLGSRLIDIAKHDRLIVDTGLTYDMPAVEHCEVFRC